MQAVAEAAVDPTAVPEPRPAAAAEQSTPIAPRQFRMPRRVTAVRTGTACYPMFHACTSNEQCCAPNRCLNITGTLACQVEGPARMEFSAVCAIDGDDCEYVVFVPLGGACVLHEGDRAQR